MRFPFQIGDETFIIAALMAMRHSRSVVLSGALTALGVMTVSIHNAQLGVLYSEVPEPVLHSHSRSPSLSAFPLLASACD